MDEKRNVLVIDDESSVRLSLSHYLGKLGFHADLAQSGSEGLKLFHEGSYDLVICDSQMGEISGIEVTREIINSSRPVPVILLVNYIEVTMAYDAMRKVLKVSF